jgi:pimeloyl-ACP methyl ester carboxylesterase
MNQLAPEALRAYVEHGFRPTADRSIELRCAVADEARLYEEGTRHGAYERLGEVGCVVTVGHGRTSEPGPARAAVEIVDRLPHGHAIAFDHLGHFGPLEAPAEIGAAVADHLVRVGETTR